MKTTMIGGAIVGLLATGTVASAGTTIFQLHDHPDASAQPPLYGLRLDNLFGPGETTTFSFDQGGASMFLTVTDNGGPITINISGTVFGGVDTGAGWDSPALYNVDFDYVAGVSAVADGWEVVDSAANQGTISTPSGDVLLDIGDAFGNSFYLLADGHRIDGDDSTWVGRGWLALEDGSNSTGSRDWLFTAEIIPLPGTAAMAGLGLLGVSGLRRRRSV